MAIDCPVNDLIEALHAAPYYDRRATRHVGRLLVQCQQVCSDWRPETG